MIKERSESGDCELTVPLTREQIQEGGVVGICDAAWFPSLVVAKLGDEDRTDREPEGIVGSRGMTMFLHRKVVAAMCCMSIGLSLVAMPYKIVVSGASLKPVSYTHLTLPTILRV